MEERLTDNMKQAYSVGASDGQPRGAERRQEQRPEPRLSQRLVEFEAKYTPDAEVISCPMTEIDMIVKGNGIHRFFGQSVPCSEGDIYIVQENVPHGFFAAEDGGGLTVRRVRLYIRDWFEGDAALPENPSYCFGVFPDGMTVSYAMLPQNAREEIGTLIDKAFAEVQEQPFEWEYAVRAHLSLLFITVSRFVQSAVQTSTSLPKEHGIMLSVLRTVDEHFSENDLTLEKIASAHYMSTSVLSRMFGQYMGQPFSVFIRNYRLDQVCRLLRETDEPVNRIVARCGIKDIPSFYRSFGKYAGMTPNQYRKKHTVGAVSGQAVSPCARIAEKVQAGHAKDVSLLITEALEAGYPAHRILDEGLVAGMTAIGEKFNRNEVFVPEVLMAARAMNFGLQILKPALSGGAPEPIGRAVICTVKGDMHDIGKNMVRMMMEGQGIVCCDLGTDVEPARVVEAVRETNADLVCLSSLLTTTMFGMKTVIDALREAGLRDRVKVMVGGAPVTQEFADAIGADAYTDNAAAAAQAALRLLGESGRSKEKAW